jgi:ABC-type branched-subunit amino acid transport system permease subunit
MLIAWVAHLAVSVAYGLMCGLVLMATMRWPFVALWTLAFTWITTVIAPPANAIIVQLVSFQQVDSSKLPALNFSFDEKLALHLVVFAAIMVAQMAYQRVVSRPRQPVV